MIDRNHKLSLTRQAQLLGISRETVYYLPAAIDDADLALMGSPRSSVSGELMLSMEVAMSCDLVHLSIHPKQ